jgi:hypothetical protein
VHSLVPGTWQFTKLTPHSIHNNHLDPNSWAFVGDCDQTTYCAEDGTCRARGCRRDMVRWLAVGRCLGIGRVPRANCTPLYSVLTLAFQIQDP